MSGFAYSVPVPSEAPSIASSTAYTVEALQVLQTEPEKLPTDLPVQGSTGYQMKTLKEVEEEMEISSGFMEMDGQKKNSDTRAQALVKQAELLELSVQHGAGPQWEKADPKHRIGELLIAAWDVYCKKMGAAAGERTDFFVWFDSIPEFDRVMMVSQKIKELGTTVRVNEGLKGLPTDYFDPRRPHTLPTGQSAGCARPGYEGRIVKEQTQVPNSVVFERNMRPSVVKAFCRGVKYLDAVSRPNYLVTFEGDRAKYRGSFFDTTTMQTVHSGRGHAIWVLDGDGNLYAGNHIFGQLHHSSFMAGDAVLCGGEVKAVDGRIVFLSGKSGHYCPPIDNLIAALKKMRERQMSLDNVHVLVWRKSSDKPTPVVLDANKVIADGGASFQGWGLLTAAQRMLLQAGRYDELR